jgi:hypothetical protein
MRAENKARCKVHILASVSVSEQSYALGTVLVKSVVVWLL